MQVVITGGQARVENPDDCTSLSVYAGLDADLAAALSGAGLAAGVDRSGELDLVVSALRALAESGPVGPGWAQRWEAMLAYAQAKGWLSDDGTTVRAHVVGPP